MASAEEHADISQLITSTQQRLSIGENDGSNVVGTAKVSFYKRSVSGYLSHVTKLKKDVKQLMNDYGNVANVGKAWMT